MIREALAALLSFEGDIEVVAQVGRGDEVVKAAEATNPDVAVLDIEMPGIDGLTAAADLKKNHPDIKIVILTTFGRPGFLRRAMESGVSAFLVKDSPADKLTQTIRRVLAGERSSIRIWRWRRWPTASTRSPRANATCSRRPRTAERSRR